jgi:hypothetical protein
MSIPEVSRINLEGKQIYELVSIVREPSSMFPVRIEYKPMRELKTGNLVIYAQRFNISL